MVGFYSISIHVSYLMPNSLYIHIYKINYVNGAYEYIFFMRTLTENVQS